MKALLYKEWKLIVNPLFLLVPLFSVLILIPQWVFFVALLYFCFMSAPNLFTLSKTYNEVYFSASQPVRRRDIVKARVLTLVVLEVLQILAAAACVAARLLWMHQPNFFIDPNLAFLGLNFVMFGLFNLVLLPMFFKTGYKIAMPVVLATAAAVVFAAAVELGVTFVPFVRVFDGMRTTWVHIAALLGGAALFAGMNWIACRVSVARFEKIDL